MILYKMILAIGIYILIKGILSIFFNLSNIPGLGGQSPIYYDDVDDGILFGYIKLVVGLIVSVYAVIRMRKFKTIKTIEYSKCPKCKEAYTYLKLEDGMCPKCDVKTIDMDKYYDKS